MIPSLDLSFLGLLRTRLMYVVVVNLYESDAAEVMKV